MLKASASAKVRFDEHLLDPFAGARALLLAVSGGPDSMALLALASDWRKQPGRPNVYAATVDHGLRPQSRLEAESVARWSERLETPHATLAWEGAKPRSRIQERAREARYALLSAEASRVGADVVLTGHHADDQYETILFRLLRGSGPAGLAGMASIRNLDGGLRLGRPFLAVPKAALVDYCVGRGQEFISDPSNEDPRFARARLRRILRLWRDNDLPEPDLLRLSRRAARAEDALSQGYEAFRRGLEARTDSVGVSVNRDQLAEAPEEFLVRLLLGEIGRLSGRHPPRLEAVEACASRLRAALRDQAPFAATLGGAILRLRAHSLDLVPEAARRGRRSRGVRSLV